ncbi:DnaQ-like DNA polymerase III subunit [Gordonia phage Powerball]|uniref:DnaQ-like DNA polymerase III subunit n=1 Tax=Gordonia phage Powerball TaxID=2599847 RepID=A0A5J6TTU6_9CAUD|nr:DnaQ-like DNA polymerase III subunit [Gordonia phage Powerball]QFG13484.1 DnaQ-like DNA polymerase III subunit [Gordonia phage Powerball]
MTTYAFVDTETTGLTIDDEVWEFAAILRRDDGTESTVHLHIEHDWHLADDLPEKFHADHDARFGMASGMHVYTRSGAASIIHAALHGAHIVGVNPAFDAGMLQRLLHQHGLQPSWNYHLIDLEALTLGYLIGRGEHVDMPWRSDDLAAQVMPVVDPDGEPMYARHTALGDAQWCRDWWDALTAGGAL